MKRWLKFAQLLFICVTIIGAASYASRYYFGSAGRDGQDGSSGYSGRGGADIVVTAEGQKEYFDLRGSDGSQGSDGYNGDDAYNCYQDYPNYDLEGALGGNGGDGGNGGSGGNGGDIQVYYQNPTFLKQIFVDSTPGRGSYSGNGARGGYGCRCSQSSWVNRVCWQEERYTTICTPAGCRQGSQGCSCRTEKYYEEVCENRRYDCVDGSTGRDGRAGSYGSDGSYGSIRLVNRLEPLEATDPELDIPVETVMNEAFVLTRHEWQRMSGALTLFAPGSRLRNEYEKYEGKTTKSVSFNWLDAVRPPDYYRGQRVSLSLQGKPASTNVSFPSSMLVDSKILTTGDKTLVEVRKSMRTEELTKVFVEETQGTGLDLTLVLADQAKVSELAKTHVFIKSGWDLEGGGEWENWVPEDLIRNDGHHIYVNIGRLPNIKVSKIQKYFAEKCEFEMKVEREFVGTRLRVARDGGNVFDVKKELKKNKPIEVKMKNKDW